MGMNAAQCVCTGAVLQRLSGPRLLQQQQQQQQHGWDEVCCCRSHAPAAGGLVPQQVLTHCSAQNREKARSKKDFFGSGGFGGEV